MREPVVADLDAAALPGARRPGLRHAGAAQPRGQARRLHRRGDRRRTASSPTFRKLFQLAARPAHRRAAAHRRARLAPASARCGFTVTGPSFSHDPGLSDPDPPRLGAADHRDHASCSGPATAFTPPPACSRGLAAGTVTLQVSYSPFRGFDPAPIAASLSRYPYGCTEQLVSAAYPLLYAPRASSTIRKVRRRAPAGLNEAVGKLLDRQTPRRGLRPVARRRRRGRRLAGRLRHRLPDGGPKPTAPRCRRQAHRPGAGGHAADLPAGRLGLGLLPAGVSGAGGPADKDARKKATERMRRRASAYALYVLAKGGRGDLARLRWWHDVQFKTERSPLARAQVGAGLAMMGDRARARSAFRQAVAGARLPRGERLVPEPAARPRRRHRPGLRGRRDRHSRASLQGRLENAGQGSRQPQHPGAGAPAAGRPLRCCARPGPMRIDATGATPADRRPAARRAGRVGKLADARFANRGTGRAVAHGDRARRAVGRARPARPTA